MISQFKVISSWKPSFPDPTRSLSYHITFLHSTSCDFLCVVHRLIQPSTLACNIHESNELNSQHQAKCLHRAGAQVFVKCANIKSTVTNMISTYSSHTYSSQYLKFLQFSILLILISINIQISLRSLFSFIRIMKAKVEFV